MKALIYGTLSVALVLSVVPTATAEDFRHESATHQSSPAVTRPVVFGSADAVNATHYLGVQVIRSTLSRLTIDLPEGVEVTKAPQVTDQKGQVIETAVKTDQQRLTLNFAQPVAPGRTLKITLRGVKKSFLPNTLFYNVSGRSVGTTADIPLGLARVQTYDSIR